MIENQPSKNLKIGVFSMYNDKNRPHGGYSRRGAFGKPTGASRPTFAQSNIASDLPGIDENNGGRLCDGSFPTPRRESGNCGDVVSGFGLSSHPLAMVYSPLQEFRDIYTPDVALERGTMFSELDLPFEGSKGKKGGCCL